MKIPNKQQLLLAVVGLLAAIFIAAPVAAQTISETQSANLGNLAAASSGTTVFNFSSVDGTVTRSSGSGARVSAGATNIIITLSCNAKWCNVNDIRITIKNIGSPTGRAGALTNFTATMGNAVLSSGTPSVPANPQVFTIQGMGGSSRTFTIGADFPIAGDSDVGAGASGPATSGYEVTMEDTVKSNAATPMDKTVGATVFHALSVSPKDAQGNVTYLEFGRIVKPASGTGSVTYTASNNNFTVVNGVALGSATSHHLGAFTVTGEGGQVISFAINNNSPYTVSNGTDTISITPSVSPAGIQTLSGSLGGTGTITYSVGGSFNLRSSMSSGAYSGVMSAVATYN